MFDARYQLLAENMPACGRVAVLPWDTEIFAFAVGDYEPGELSAVWAGRDDIRVRLRDWAAENGVELIGCSVAAAEPRWRVLLPALGFTYVDTTLDYSIAPVSTRTPRPTRRVRLAMPADQPAVERICEHGFHAGRYHADARFPRPLAQKRYRTWLAREFENLSDENRVYVGLHTDEVVGFIHLRVRDQQAYMTIGGSYPPARSRTIAAAMFGGAINALRESGVRRIESKLSAGNTAMMNLAAMAGARFTAPRHVYHWHAPDAVHLLAAESLLS